MLIAITGATGFVGRHVARVLVSRGHRVRALVRSAARRPGALAGVAVETVPGDLGDATALAALARGADALIHLVGIITEAGTATFEAVHVAGTRRLLAAAEDARVGRFVHMSAVGARDQPGATPYHRSKWRGEELVRRSSIASVIFRPSIISGPESAPIRTLARLHRWSPLVPVFGDGRFPTQPVWIEDVALAFARATENAALTGAFELGGPAALSYEAFLKAIGRRSPSCGRRPLRSTSRDRSHRSRVINCRCWSKGAPPRRTRSSRRSAFAPSPSRRGSSDTCDRRTAGDRQFLDETDSFCDHAYRGVGGGDGRSSGPLERSGWPR